MLCRNNIFSRIIKFWLHLETLPENSVAKQCLHISNQLACNGKQSFMSTINKPKALLYRAPKELSKHESYYRKTTY